MSSVIKKQPVPGRIKAVLFDLDDTLLDSASARIQALQKVFAGADITGCDASNFLFGLHGLPFKDGLDRLRSEFNVPNDLFTEYRRAYWLGVSGERPFYPGVRDMLEQLRSRNIVLGIVTQKGRDFEFEGRRVGAFWELEKLEVTGLFSVIIGFEDVSRQKPDPAGINFALTKTGSRPRETLFVGDSPADIEAAVAAGCWSCRATWSDAAGLSRCEELPADYVAVCPEDVIRIIGGIS